MFCSICTVCVLVAGFDTLVRKFPNFQTYTINLINHSTFMKFIESSSKHAHILIYVI